MQGDIYINGTPIEKVREWYIANTGYVLQLATPYYEELTVRENLTLAAQLTLSKGHTLRAKFERVEQVMQVVRTLDVYNYVAEKFRWINILPSPASLVPRALPTPDFSMLRATLKNREWPGDKAKPCNILMYSGIPYKIPLLNGLVIIFVMQ